MWLQNKRKFIKERSIKPLRHLSNNPVSSLDTLIPILINKMVKLKETSSNCWIWSLSQDSMPLIFQWHSFSIIVYIFSHLPTPIVVNLSPLETLFKQQPIYTFIKIFSYSCYPFLILIISINYLSILTNMFFLATTLLIKPTNTLILLAVFTFKKC